MVAWSRLTRSLEKVSKLCGGMHCQCMSVRWGEREREREREIGRGKERESEGEREREREREREKREEERDNVFIPPSVHHLRLQEKNFLFQSVHIVIMVMSEVTVTIPFELAPRWS